MRTRTIALIVGLALVLTATPAHADADVTRLAGANRFDSSAEINCCNADGSPRNIQSIVLASGLHFADALAGNFLAGVDNGILLLTDGQSLSPGVRDLLESVPDGAIASSWVMGGTAAVSEGAVDDLVEVLSDHGHSTNVERVAGSSAIDTAVAATRRRGDQVGRIGTAGKWAVVAAVGGFADSLAVAPVAYAAALPILYTGASGLADATKFVLEDLDFTNVLLVGGTAAVSDRVASDISSLGITVQRLAGPTRQETSVAIAEFAIGNVPDFDGKEFAIARGDAFADALAGGTHAGFVGAPVLLTHSPTQLGPAATGFLERQSGTLERGWAYGGTGALSDSVLQEAREATEGA